MDYISFVLAKYLTTLQNSACTVSISAMEPTFDLVQQSSIKAFDNLTCWEFSFIYLFSLSCVIPFVLKGRTGENCTLTILAKVISRCVSNWFLIAWLHSRNTEDITNRLFVQNNHQTSKMLTSFGLYFL